MDNCDSFVTINTQLTRPFHTNWLGIEISGQYSVSYAVDFASWIKQSQSPVFVGTSRSLWVKWKMLFLWKSDWVYYSADEAWLAATARALVKQGNNKPFFFVRWIAVHVDCFSCDFFQAVPFIESTHQPTDETHLHSHQNGNRIILHFLCKLKWTWKWLVCVLELAESR